MNNFKYKLAQFMTGRNGPDELYYAMLIFTIILDIGDIFIRNRIYTLFITIVVVLTFFRFFSKNIYARQKENQKFLELIDKIKNKDFNFKKDPYDATPKKKTAFQKKAKGLKIRFRDRKTHVFKTCPQCGITIRLPKKSGEHTVCCPKCGRDFKVKIR